MSRSNEMHTSSSISLAKPLPAEPDLQISRPATRSYPWKPGLWTQLPYHGLGALLGVLLLTGAAVAVLVLSNNSPIENWHVKQINVQPQVWVSILSTVMNMLLGYAFVEGLAVSFWRQVGHGTTLRSLHDHYESMSLNQAILLILQGRFSVVAIACLVVTASTARGPLFQRASTIGNSTLQPTEGFVDLQIANFLPHHYFRVNRFGQLNGDGGIHSTSMERSRGFAAPIFKSVINNLTADNVYIPNLSGCGDRCTTSIRAAGFRVVCERSSYELNFTAETLQVPYRSRGCILASDESDCTAQDRRKHPEAKVFGVDFDPGVSRTDDSGSRVSTGINITTTFKTISTCRGTVPTHKCTLIPGLVEYAVVLQQNSISLQHPHWQNDTFIHETSPGSFDSRYWLSVASMMFPPVRVNMTHPLNTGGSRLSTCIPVVTYDPEVTESGQRCAKMTDMMLKDLSASYSDPLLYAHSTCNYTWQDPMQDLIDGLRQFAFRASIDAAAVANRSILFSDVWPPSAIEARMNSLTANWTQQVRYEGVERRTVYSTNRAYLISAVLTSIIGILPVLPLYYGWWELGRAVSLNPLEVVKAFGAPILDHVNSNADRSGIVKQVSRERVRYGVVVDEKAEGELSSCYLRVELDREDARLARPEPGTIFN